MLRRKVRSTICQGPHQERVWHGFHGLSEEIRFTGNKILDENFDTYKLPLFSWLPQIETVLVDNPAVPPQGCGEPAITPMGAVIARAVYDAIGVRLYELPMTPTRVRKAMADPSEATSKYSSMSMECVALVR